MGNNKKNLQVQKAEEANDLTKQRDLRCVPLARRVLQVIAMHVDSVPLGDVPESKRRDFEEAFKPVAAEILALYLEADIPIDEVNFVRQLVLQPVESAMNMVAASVQKHIRDAEDKAFGCQVGRIGMVKLDKILKGEEGGLAKRAE